MKDLFYENNKLSLGRIFITITFFVIVFYSVFPIVFLGKMLEAPSILHTTFVSLLAYVGNTKIQMRIKDKEITQKMGG